jgi:hypothetical protein
MVLVSAFGNDAHRVVFSDKEYLNKRKFYKIFSKFRVGHPILALFDIILIYQKKEKDFIVPRVNLGDYKHHLNEIIRISKEQNIKCVLLTRPFIGESPNELWWKNFAPDYNLATIEIAKKNNIIVIETYEFFKNKESFFSDESHFNESGHKVAASLIYKEIKHLIPAY